MNEILCVATFDIICSSNFQIKCVNYSMQTPHHVMLMTMENLIFIQYRDNFNIVATLTWPSVGVKPNTWKSWGFGVLRDSRMFRARQ